MPTAAQMEARVRTRTLAFKGLAWCNKCEQVKDLDDFSPGRNSNGRTSFCKECMREYPQDHRTASIRKRWGMTPEEYDTIMQEPCAICGDESKHLDHDHETGAVRSPLCAPCNMALGLLNDDPDRLRAAADYLELFDA